MTRSVAIIGAGQIAYAVAAAFVTAGWRTRILARNAPAWQVEDARYIRYVAGNDAPPSADAIVDTIAFDDGDVTRYDPLHVGRLIVVSSASVYCDEHGRTLDEAAQNGFPRFGEALFEDCATVEPGPQTYSTRKVRMERAALARFGKQVTILRPCAVYGPWSRHPREWWFVKRLLDRRDRIPLFLSGASRFHTTDVADIAGLALHAATHSAEGVYNIGDQTGSDVRTVGETIAAVMGREVLFVDAGGEGLVGRTPWSVPRPFLIDSAKAMVDGYTPAATYSPQAAVQWLADHASGGWRAAFPQLAAYPYDLFDYDAEDRFFSSH